MKPILTKTETTTAYGIPVILTGEVYDKVYKQTADRQLYTRIRIENERGVTIHPDFLFQVQYTESELDKELTHIKNKMVEKPELYFPNYKKEENESSSTPADTQGAI